MLYSLPYVPLTNFCPTPGPDESVIPVKFRDQHITNATFDGVSYNFELVGNINSAVISGALMYVPLYADVESPSSPNGKRRRYTAIEIVQPEFVSRRSAG